MAEQGETTYSNLTPHEAALLFFNANGWTPEQSVGIVANLHHESAGLQPDILENGGKGPGYGLAQWTDEKRKKGLFEYAASKRESKPSFATQLEYVQKELMERPEFGAAELRQAKTAEEATQIFSRLYERPGKPHMASRLQYAREIMGQLFGPSEAQVATIPPIEQKQAPIPSVGQEKSTDLPLSSGAGPIQSTPETPIVEPPKSEPSVLGSLLSPSEASAAEIPKPVDQPATKEPTRLELIAEAYKRGILPPEMKADYEEAMRRGLVPNVAPSQPQTPAEQPQIPTKEIDYPNKLKRPYTDEQLAKVRGMSRTERFLQGVGVGLTDFVRGIEQLGAAATKQDELYDYVTQKGIEERKESAPLLAVSPEAKVGKLVGQTAPTLAIPQAVPESLLGRAAIGAVTGAGLGAAGFTEPGENRGTNAAVGALAGAAGSAATSAAMGGVNLAKGPPNTPTRELAKKWGIRTSLAEDLEGQSSRTDVMMERVPAMLGGRKNWRYKQREEAHAAAKSAIGKYMVNPADEIGGSAAYEANREYANSLYEGLKNIVAQVPNQQIQPASTKPIAEALLDRFPDIFKTLQDKKVERILLDIKKGTADIPEKVVKDPNTGWPVTIPSQPKTLTFDEAWELRKGLGDLIGMARKKEAGGDVHREALGQFKALFRAVSDDIDNWAGSIGQPEISAALKTANGAYKDYVVKYDILQRAYDKASKETGDNVVFSPARFANELDRIMKKEKYVKRFTEEEVQELTGLANILQVVKRSGQYLENPPTGNRWGPLTLAGGVEGAAYHTAGLAGAAKTAGIAAATGWVNRFLTTTEAGKRLAMSAAKVAPVSPAMNKIVDQIYKQVPKFAAEMSQLDLPRAELGESINVE